MITSIYQEVELSLTENLIPVTVPVKQYDNRARKVRCVLYNNSVQYSVPQDCIVACSGTRPDGTIFHYTSETASDLVFVENGAVVFTITTFMTAQAGRFPLDVVMLSTAGGCSWFVFPHIEGGAGSHQQRQDRHLYLRRCCGSHPSGTAGSVYHGCWLFCCCVGGWTRFQ